MLYYIAKIILYLLGWKCVQSNKLLPSKYIVIAEQHTSLWDAFYSCLFIKYWQVKHIYIMTSDKYWYASYIFYILGINIIYINTTVKENKVNTIAKKIKEIDFIGLHLAPSGARKKKDCWRSGFYHIAREANIPIVLSFLDFSTKTFGHSKSFYLTGDYIKDMDKIRAFYKNKRGLHPNNESRIFIKEEQQSKND